MQASGPEIEQITPAMTGERLPGAILSLNKCKGEVRH